MLRLGAIGSLAGRRADMLDIYSEGDLSLGETGKCLCVVEINCCKISDIYLVESNRAVHRMLRLISPIIFPQRTNV